MLSIKPLLKCGVKYFRETSSFLESVYYGLAEGGELDIWVEEILDQ